MSIPNTQALATYKELIKEVYIDPIRSAVLIDDDFPTLDEYLNEEQNPTSSSPVLKNLLKACREEPNHWLVDVHNGKVNATLDESARYRHLHHSDLMILDYHLDGDDTNSKALKILQSLASNNYFNMVVVYTKGTPEELRTRVLEIVRGLTFNRFPSENFQAPSAISEWEDDEENIVNTLKYEFKTDFFLYWMQEKNIDSKKYKNHPSFEPLCQLIAARQKKIKKNIDCNEILDWLTKEKIQASQEVFSSTNIGKVDFSIQNQSATNWIRTNNLFVTVVAKSTDASLIPTLLLDALESSGPSPHRLLMTKMRNSLEDIGVNAEALVVKKGNVQAGLLWQIMQAEPHELSWKLQETIERHWEQLSTEIEVDIHDYGMRLFNTVLNEHQDNKTNGIKKYTEIDLNHQDGKNGVTKELNSFICSRKPNGVHLKPGQIFSVPSDSDGANYWLCLSPACDLVPVQNKGKWHDKNIMQFTAVKLWEKKSPIDSKMINSNEYLFVKINDEVVCFSYTNGPGSNPFSEQFYAMENGLINGNRIRFLSLNEIDSETLTMKSKLHDAEIVTQLRYEYAINLMQKLGTSLTRVGLDFVSIP